MHKRLRHHIPVLLSLGYFQESCMGKCRNDLKTCLGRWMLVLIFIISAETAGAQFLDSGSGLLQAPSAEMNRSGTFMITNNFLNKHSLSPRWGYHTFGYGFNITFWSRLEVGYVMAIFDGKRHPNPSDRDLIMFNQDRHFTAKVLLLHEGDFGFSWIPALAIGVSDPVTGSGSGEYIGSNIEGSESGGNGFFNRNYIVATKHFDLPIGVFGAHLGYQFNRRVDRPMNAPIAALDWHPVWLQKENWITTKLIAEYDARNFNAGFLVSVWRDHFDLMFDFQALKWVSAGIRYKLILK